MSTPVTEDQDDDKDAAGRPRGLRRRAVTVVGVGAVVVLALLATGAVGLIESGDGDPPATSAGSPDLAVVGDSFAQQSNPQLEALANAQGLTVRAYGLGGTSICHFEGVFDELAQSPPRVLVLSFAGNDLPHSCFNPTGEARDAETVAAGYRPELDAVTSRFLDLGSEVYVVLPPPIRDAQYEARASAMRALYREAHEAEPDLGLIDSATTLDPGGEGYVASLPCDDADAGCPAGGEVVVRQDDGIHLTYAGGQRYAQAILDAVARDL